MSSLPANNSSPAPAARAGARFSGFPALKTYLDGLGLFRMTPGLERVAAMLDRLGLRRPPYTVVQVVGTNGKGSTSTMLAALAAAHGLKTGLHVSPHFVSVRERVRVNGAMLPEAAWTDLGNTLMDRGGEELSYFEFVTALAVLAFAEAGVDLAVMETGLGGSYDATTALDADLAVFTPMGLDHQAVLGLTLHEIATDKAGAVRPGKPAFSVPQRPEARAALRRAALERNALLTEVPSSYPLPPGSALDESGRILTAGPWGHEPCSADGESLVLGLAGSHQYGNARLALAVWHALRRGGMLSASALHTVDGALSRAKAEVLEAQALAGARLPGRLQYVPPLAPHAGRAGQWTAACGATAEQPGSRSMSVSVTGFMPCPLGWPPILLDGAHNGHGLAALGRSLARAGVAPAAVIFSCLADKDPEDMLPLLRALATGPIFVPPIQDNPRAAVPGDLAAAIGLNAAPVGSLTEALQKAAGHMAERLPESFAGRRPLNPLLICGSLYLLGEFFAIRPDCLAG